MEGLIFGGGLYPGEGGEGVYKRNKKNISK